MSNRDNRQELGVRKGCAKLVWWFALLASALTSPVFSPAQAPPVDAAVERDFKDAMSAQDRGDLAAAESLLSKIHRAHPGIFAVDESLGLLLASRGDLDGALPLLKAAVSEQPHSDAAHANLGAALYQAHRNDAAAIEFQTAVRINPKNVQALQSMGRIYMDGRKPADAAKALLAAQQLKQDDPDLKLDCITTLLAANRVDEARSLLTEIPNADQSARAQSLLGEADEKSGQFHEAVEHFARATELEPSEESAWMLGIEFLRHWNFDAAGKEFQAASEKFPKSIRLRVGLGAALFGDEQYAMAIPVFADLLKHDPDNAAYADMLGLACNAPSEVKSPECSALVKYAQSHPADANGATQAAEFMLRQDRDNNSSLVDARKLLARAIAANPNLPDAQFQMGVVLQDLFDWKGSISYLEHAVNLKPDFAQAHYRLARAYWKAGRTQDGQAQMELQKKYARQERDDLDRRLKRITRFVVELH
jgi:tetratricopeptide (TPR) repeat protein